jgi:2-keto-4-pentenoate hydratase/2-oxohepta-3-ene-1,7-dioic acid hydratase in catechol pathway
MWDVYELVSFISQMMTLNPGDIVTTGTPAGIGQLNNDDKISIIIEGIGELNNIVIN